MKKNTMLATVLLTALTAFANQAEASAAALSQESMDHLTIESVRVEDITEQYEAQQNQFEFSQDPQDLLNQLSNQNPVLKKLEVIDVAVDKIINIGTKIWNVIEKGRPVVNYSSMAANALPQGTRRWDQLQNWRRPTSKVMSVTYTNLFGIDVVKFTYRVNMLYGGDVAGVGRYIGYANVEPLEMTTAWGYNFNAAAQVESVFNMGSSANPLAGMILNIKWTVKTVLKSTTETHTYTLDANGRIATPPSQFNGLQ